MLNYIDIILLLIIISSVITGYYRGFILGILDIIRWVGSLVLGLFFYKYLVFIFNTYLDWNSLWVEPVSFFIAVIFFSLLIQSLGLAAIRRLPPTIHNQKGNKVLGLVPGIFNGLVTAAILAIILLALPLPEGIQHTARESKLLNGLAGPTDRLETALAPIFEKAVTNNLNNLTVEPDSKAAVELPFKVTRTRPRPELEAEMLNLVNQERRAKGLKPLVADTALRAVARQHSKDMFNRGYFSHRSPEGSDPFDRIRRANIRFLAAGENLALAPTLSIAHTGLMNSPGHRANILQKRFGRVGIGVIDGGRYGLMVTQNFRN
jgi:uncharacterized protein YkwD